MDNGSTGQEPNLYRGHHTNVSSISGRVISDELADQLSQETHLILQINERRAPMLILADVCWLSFFTVPVLRSNILPLKPKEDWIVEESHGNIFFKLREESDFWQNY